MHTKTFEHNGATVSFAELVSPRQLRDLAKKNGMTGPEARRFAQQDWGLHGLTSKEMLDALAGGHTRTEAQLLTLRGVAGNYGILVFQAGQHQYRFVLPLHSTVSRELLNALTKQTITITWHEADTGDTRKTRHQLSPEQVTPVADSCQEDVAYSEEEGARMLAAALESLTSKEFVPSLIDDIGVKAVFVSILYEPHGSEVIAATFA
jgi:hypothetical protein